MTRATSSPVHAPIHRSSRRSGGPHPRRHRRLLSGGSRGRLRHPGRRRLGSLLSLLLLLLLAGCGFELPKAPYFETNISIPLGRERATGWDLVNGSEFVIGDSSGANPLMLFFEGSIDSFRIGERLDITLPRAEFSTSLGRIQLRDLDPIAEVFRIGDLLDLSIPIEGDSLVVPPFVLPVVRRALPAQHTFNWMRLHSGHIAVTVTNLLPVRIGIDGNGRVALGVRILDRTDGSELIAIEIPESIAPGDVGVVSVPLQGIEVRRLMDIEVSGESPGSLGRRVWVARESGIDVGARFQQLEPDSVTAAVGAQSVTLADTLRVDLQGDLGIVGGTVATGSIPIVISNEIALLARGTLQFAELVEDGRPVTLAVELPAAQAGLPGRYDAVIELAGRRIRSLDGNPLADLTYTLDLETEASRGVISLGRRQRVVGSLERAAIGFESVAAQPNRTEIDVPVTETEIDLPEQVSDLELVEASLRLVLENAVSFPAHASVTLRGASGKTAVVLPIDFEISPGTPAAPVESIFELDQSDSRLLELIHARPSSLQIEGVVAVGTDGRVAEVRREDWIRGRYEVSAPLRVVVGTLDHDVEDFDFGISVDAQDRIRDDVAGVVASGIVENHFPLAAEARIVLASSAEGLDDSPEISLEPILVGAGVVDPANGRVVTSTTSEFRISLAPEDISFFARDRVHGRFSLRLLGDSLTVVELTATDFAEISALLEFRLGIGTANEP